MQLISFWGLQIVKNRKIGNIKKVGPNKYKIRVSAGTDDFGKRVVINKTVNATSDTQAEKIMMQIYLERKKYINSSGAPKTLEDLYNVFFSNHLKNLTPNTREYYKNVWKHLSEFKKIKIENLNILNINKILEAQAEGKTKNSVYKMLQTMINKAQEWGYYKDINPCTFVPTPKYKAPEKAILSADDINIIIELLAKEKIKYQCIFYLACILSLRREEIVGIKENKIDFKNSTLKIKYAATATYNEVEDKTILKETKTPESERILYIPPFLLKLLKELIKENKINRLKLGDLYMNNGYLFTKYNGDLMSIYTPSQWWKKFRTKHKIAENVTLHGLRHSGASIMLKKGVDISTVSKVLGHANIEITLKTYAHLFDDSRKEAIETVADLFNVN